MRSPRIKPDVYQEFPLWFQDPSQPSSFVGNAWRDAQGFRYRTTETPPQQLDFVFLVHLQKKAMETSGSLAIQVSRCDLLRQSGVGIGLHWYKRLEESLSRWTAMSVEYQGNFYDGRNYQRKHFHIIDSWEILRGSKRLFVRFSPEWLACMQHVNPFAHVDFEHIKKLRNSLATRLHKHLVERFYYHKRWEVDAQELANSLGMKEKYPSLILPKLQVAMRRISQQTPLDLELRIRKPRRGKATLIFQKAKREIPFYTDKANKSKWLELSKPQIKPRKKAPSPPSSETTHFQESLSQEPLSPQQNPAESPSSPDAPRAAQTAPTSSNPPHYFDTWSEETVPIQTTTERRLQQEKEKQRKKKKLQTQYAPLRDYVVQRPRNQVNDLRWNAARWLDTTEDSAKEQLRQKAIELLCNQTGQHPNQLMEAAIRMTMVSLVVDYLRQLE